MKSAERKRVKLEKGGNGVKAYSNDRKKHTNALTMLYTVGGIVESYLNKKELHHF